MQQRTSVVLLVGADRQTVDPLETRLIHRGYHTGRAADSRQAMSTVAERMPDLVVLAPPLRDEDFRVAVDVLREAAPDLTIILAGRPEVIDPAGDLLRHVFDCVYDPLEHPERLLRAVGYALGMREEDRELAYLRERDDSAASMIGESRAMQTIFSFVRRVCARTANGAAPTFLLSGETGTGKGALAKMIHRESVRRHRPFVEVNCAALPASLLEAELFGYERGAFTDAGRGKEGLFVTADGGTLLLDEVASLSLELQAKLLTAIEDRQVRRVGGREPRLVNVQLIAAAQPERLKSGFREDLFHRLNVLSVKLPLLQDRGDDAVRLAERFVTELCAQYAMEPLVLDESALRFIRSYRWPGNVRELRNQIERIVLLSEGARIQGWQFERASAFNLERELTERSDRFEFQLPPNGIDLGAVERDIILAALELHDGNVSKTARYLSVTRQTLTYRIRKHGLDA